MSNEAKLPLVYSCSGASSAALMVNHIAVRLDRLKAAEMSCIAAVGGDAKPLREIKGPVRHPPPIVLTIGHSTRTIEEFIGLLQAHGATCVVDVRTVPRSWHNPQFNKAALPRALKKARLGYVHLPGLGGLRHAKRDSLNVGWRNASFRGYADYMQTPEFEQSLEELIRLAKQGRIAIMCAEAVPWRCHRSLIADALLVRGIRAEDIMSPTRRQVHILTPFAKVRGTMVTYPAEVSQTGPKKPSAKRAGSRPIKAT
jgi:hypothetical protein